MESLNVFKDESVLEIGWMPPELPHRGEQLSKLKVHLSSASKLGMPTHILLYGGVGSGKSVTAKKAVVELAIEASKQEKDLRWIAINCNDNKSSYSILNRVLKSLDARLPLRNLELGEMLNLLASRLKERDTHLMVILDDVDEHLNKDGSRLIHAFTRFGESYLPWTKVKRYAGVSLMLTSREQVLDKLPAQTLSSLGHSCIEFESYSSKELLDIVNQRVELAFIPGAISEEICRLISDFSAERGDARLAIELLLEGGKLAEAEFRKVNPEDARTVFANAGFDTKETEKNLYYLGKHEKLALLGLARESRSSAYLAASKGEEAYRIQCEIQKETPREHEQFLDFLKVFDDYGFVGLRPDEEEGLICLRLPARDLEKKLEELLEKRRA
ncbi:MAG TPA: AAA family ATPase [Thermoplasmata archaeon]|nr:AAA family ATPase [Thermoplasmata archaeon]HIH97571.1 AAA family ATPase [Thermoplasmata archaeon]